MLQTCSFLDGINALCGSCNGEWDLVFFHFQEKSQPAQIFDPVELNLKIFEEDQLIGDEMNFIDYI